MDWGASRVGRVAFNRSRCSVRRGEKVSTLEIDIEVPIVTGAGRAA